MAKKRQVVSVDTIQQRIVMVRGVKVIIDADLAGFYGVETKRLNEQVKRNSARFPEDFMFVLKQGEKDELVAKCDQLSNLRFSKALPHAFTEHGALMAASVLSTTRAVETSVFVIRAFVMVREVVSGHRELARRVAALETHLAHHDENTKALIRVIRKLAGPDDPPKMKRIGFSADSG